MSDEANYCGSPDPRYITDNLNHITLVVTGTNIISFILLYEAQLALWRVWT